jgi:hypothetical protein
MRTLRVSLAVALLAALLVQSVVAIAAPAETRARGHAPVMLPYQLVPPSQRSTPAWPPAQYVPGRPLPAVDKDPRHC